MARGRALINGVEVMKMEELPKEFQTFEKAVKQALIGIGTVYNFDYDNDTVSLEYDLGEGFRAILTKTKDTTT